MRQESRNGIADPRLAPEGEEQARRLAAYLAAEQLGAVYSSPLRRAVETARPLAERLRLEVRIVDEVAEFDRDASEYVPVEELKAADDPRWHALVGNGPAAGPAATDADLEAFRARVVGAVEGLVAAHPGERIAVACHAGVINVYLAHVLGLPAGRWVCHPGYTAIHRIAASRQGHRNVVTMNETAHLRGSGLTISPGWAG